MSFRLLNEVTMIDGLTQTEKVIIMLLANASNDKTGQCNPSQAFLAKRASVTRQTVNAAIKNLEQKKILKKIARFSKTGGRLSSQYVVLPENIPCKDFLHTMSDNPTPPVSDDDTPCQLARQVYNKKQNKKHKTTEDKSSLSDQVVCKDNLNANIVIKRFDAFWNTYPKRVGKGDARKVWIKIKPDDQLTNQIILAVNTQKKTDQWSKDNGQYIPNPATWLRQERWEDEVTAVKNSLPPRLRNSRKTSFGAE